MNQKTSKVEKEFYLRCSYLTLSVLFDKEPKNLSLAYCSFLCLLTRQLLVTVIPNINIAFRERAISIIDPVNQNLHIFF